MLYNGYIWKKTKRLTRYLYLERRIHGLLPEICGNVKVFQNQERIFEQRYKLAVGSSQDKMLSANLG